MQTDFLVAKNRAFDKNPSRLHVYGGGGVVVESFLLFCRLLIGLEVFLPPLGLACT